MDDGDGVEDTPSAAVSDLAAGGADRIGVEPRREVLPEPPEDGINPVMHREPPGAMESSSNAIVPGGPFLLKPFARLGLPLA